MQIFASAARPPVSGGLKFSDSAHKLNYKVKWSLLSPMGTLQVQGIAFA